MSNNNTQLPVELHKKIYSDANDYLGLKEVEFSQRSFNAHVAGATEYANKLHEAQQEIKDLQGQIATCKRTIDIQIEQKHEANDLLEEVFQKHESGLLPDRFIYDKIKKFLYG